MNVSTNLRAGKQSRKRSSSTDSVDAPETVYYPPVTRCPGV